MTDNHPIIPPPELVQQWDEECDSGYNPEIDNTFDALKCFASKAAQWGADQELNECCKWLPKLPPWSADDLRKYRRPKPPSLKEQALKILEEEPEADDMKELIVFDTAQVEIIRRALEQLDD